MCAGRSPTRSRSFAGRSSRFSSTSTLILTYQAAGRETVDQVSPEAFLLVGILGMALWSAAIWAGGSSIESERSTGTINSLFLTPASRDAVVLGYSMGALIVFVLPTMAIATLLAFATGVKFDVASPIAPVLSVLALAFAAIAMAHLLSGAFVLTRRANMFANFLQTPIYVLSGMVVPIKDLPESVQWFAYVFPVSAGMEALRGTLLTGSTLSDVAEPLGRLFIVSVALFAVGHWTLGRVEHAARNAGTLDFE